MIKIKFLTLLFQVAIFFCIASITLAQGNSQNNSNGLWQPKGADTVTTNREVLIKKNLKVQNVINADSISVRKIKVGNQSIVLGGTQQQGGNGIYTDDWDLYIQCEYPAPARLRLVVW